MSQSKATVNASYQAAVDLLGIARNHRDGEARNWLSSFLKRLDWSSLKSPSLCGFRADEVDTLPPKVQIALLKACLKVMVQLREQRPERGKGLRISLDIGGVVYGIAVDLFRRPLPFSERDVCEILETTRHGCGHGGDVVPPFDLALAYAREHRLSRKLLGALKVYVGGLRGLNTVKVQSVRRKAELLATLDEARDAKRCWSERFCEGLSGLPESQQEDWRAMVVQMEAVEFGRSQENWKAKAPQVIEAMGARHILSCL
jgi:hypothetical protein